MCSCCTKLKYLSAFETFFIPEHKGYKKLQGDKEDLLPNMEDTFYSLNYSYLGRVFSSQKTPKFLLRSSTLFGKQFENRNKKLKGFSESHFIFRYEFGSKFINWFPI